MAYVFAQISEGCEFESHPGPKLGGLEIKKKLYIDHKNITVVIVVVVVVIFHFWSLQLAMKKILSLETNPLHRANPPSFI